MRKKKEGGRREGRKGGTEKEGAHGKSKCGKI
jgi:hypothetical protein